MNEVTLRFSTEFTCDHAEAVLQNATVPYQRNLHVSNTITVSADNLRWARSELSLGGLRCFDSFAGVEGDFSVVSG
jgi:hypothetical protein